MQHGTSAMYHGTFSYGLYSKVVSEHIFVLLRAKNA